MVRAAILSIGLLFLVGDATAGSDRRWIHVTVDGEDGERVRVNVPLSLIETVLPLIEDDDFRHGKIRLDDTDLDRDEVLAMLRAVDQAEDGEYVTVDDGDEHVRVAKQGKMLTVKVEDLSEGGKEHVDIQVPVAVLHALVSGDEDELDVVAAIEALGKHSDGDLVTVNDDDGTVVRIWIDDANASN
ncbi:MAG: hypothetical protein ACT4PE_07065 [Candidatus Eiseniibacteriota bacterium]